MKQTRIRYSKANNFELVTFDRPLWAAALEYAQEGLIGDRCCRGEKPGLLYKINHWLMKVTPDGAEVQKVGLTNEEAYGAVLALGLNVEGSWAWEVSFQLEDCVEQGAMRYATHLAELLYERGFDEKGEPLTEEDYLNA